MRIFKAHWLGRSRLSGTEDRNLAPDSLPLLPPREERAGVRRIISRFMEREHLRMHVSWDHERTAGGPHPQQLRRVEGVWISHLSADPSRCGSGGPAVRSCRHGSWRVSTCLCTRIEAMNQHGRSADGSSACFNRIRFARTSCPRSFLNPLAGKERFMGSLHLPMHAHWALEPGSGGTISNFRFPIFPDGSWVTLMATSSRRCVPGGLRGPG